MPVLLSRKLPVPRNAIHTALAALVVAAVFAIIWFPIHTEDSPRFIAPAAELRLSSFSPGALPILLRPLYLLIGPWAFVVLNGVLLVATAAEFSRVHFDRVRALPIVAAILLSGAATMSATIMMDIHTSFAVIGLLVLARAPSPVAWIALAVGLISHGSAIMILPAVAICVAWFFRTLRPLAAVGLAIGAWFALMLLSNYIVSGALRATPNNSLLFIANRMMKDVPESVAGYARAHPASAIAENLQAFQPLFDADPGDRQFNLLWGDNAPFKVVGYRRMRSEAAGYIWYSLAHYPLENLRASLMNGPRFIADIRPWSPDAALNRRKDVLESQVARFYPQYDVDMRKGLQFRESIDLTYSGKGTYLSFLGSTSWLVLLICLFLFSGRDLKRDLYVSLPASILSYYVINAYIIGNFGGWGSARHQVRMMLVPILFMCLSIGPVVPVIWDMVKGRIAPGRRAL